MTKILELYGVPTRLGSEAHWESIVKQEICPYLHRKCLKMRKSQPDITIGTCSVLYGKEQKEIIICPQRLLEKRQIFLDCIHLLTLHEPGNELHIVSQVGIPGGSVDYFLVSARIREVKDFVGIELQTLDTTDSDKTFGMNWKMTAKTILIQLHPRYKRLKKLTNIWCWSFRIIL